MNQNKKRKMRKERIFWNGKVWKLCDFVIGILIIISVECVQLLIKKSTNVACPPL